MWSLGSRDQVPQAIIGLELGKWLADGHCPLSSTKPLAGKTGRMGNCFVSQWRDLTFVLRSFRVTNTLTPTSLPVY